jgi:hypothetical protein
MREWIWRVAFVAGMLISSVELSAAEAVTFNKDVLPILQNNCQSCHRPGNIAPMSFLTYDTTRPWAKAMKAAVLSRKMPPWFADPQYGHFTNDRSLKQADIDTIVRWVDSGAMQGDPKDAPPPIEWPQNGWTTKPDMVLNGVPFTVEAAPAKNVIEWMTLVTPTGFTKDTWITSVEIKPSELSVTHHICISFVPHRPDAVYNTFLWVDKQRDDEGAEVSPQARKPLIPTADGRGREITAGSREAAGSPANVGIGFTCYVPGRSLNDFRRFNAALLVPAGYDISWNIHYTPNGAKVTDKPEIGLTITNEQPQRLLFTSAIAVSNFVVPPNEPNYETPPAEFTFLEDVELHWMSPHMHLRGRDMTYKLVFPDGREQIVLNVPRYDFNWQLGYELATPIKAPAGTKLVVIAHYDNSANNKFNPDKSVDPAKAVRFPRTSVSGGAD